MHVNKNKSEPDGDIEDDEYDSTWRYGGGAGMSMWRSYNSDDDGPRDLTACDKECGYCGQCMY
jgi:hypothetical protein